MTTIDNTNFKNYLSKIRTNGASANQYDYKIGELLLNVADSRILKRIEENEEIAKKIVYSDRITFPYNYFKFVEGIINHYKPETIFEEKITISSPLAHMNNREIFASIDDNEAYIFGELGLLDDRLITDYQAINGRFDLIINLNSVLTENRRASGRNLKNHNEALDFLLWCKENVSELGQIIAIIPDRILERARGSGFFNKNNIYPKAVFSIKANALRPHTGIKSNIVLLGREKCERVFFAEVAENQETNQLIWKNFVDKKNDRIVKNGVWQFIESFETIDKYIFSLEITKQLNKVKYRSTSISNISIQYRNRMEDREDMPNSIFIPKIADKNVLTSISHLDDVQKRSYIQVVLDIEACDSNYLAGYLNYGLGKTIRDYCSSSMNFNILDFNKLISYEFKLPALKIQRKIVENSNMIAVIRSNLDNIIKTNWEKPKEADSIRKNLNLMNSYEYFDTWIDSLPSPLGLILMVYSAKRSIKEKIEYLLYFFESLAEFLSILILSCYKQDEVFYSECIDRLQKGSKNPDWYRLSTFGGWVNCYQVTTKIYREIAESIEEEKKDWIHSLLGNPEDDFYCIFDKRIGKTMSDALRIRNMESHSGAAEDGLNKKKLTQLEALLNEIRSIIGYTFETAMIIAPIDCRKNKGVFNNSVYLLKGVKSSFKEDSILLNDILDGEKVYLYHQGQNYAIELFEYLKFDVERKAFYFYSKIENNKVVWVSYHYTKEPMIETDFEGEQVKPFEIVEFS